MRRAKVVPCPSMRVSGGTIRKIVLSAFCVLNLGTVVFINLPAPVTEAETRALLRLPPRAASGVRWAELQVRRWAYVAGLDNTWTLFSKLPRFDWWYVIKARYSDGSEELLPLPRQSARPFLYRNFFDHKEAKFHLNIYPHVHMRWSYGRYLCRVIRATRPAPAVAIVFELHWQHILERREALARGTHLEPESHGRLLDDPIPCDGGAPS
jgi:hypothetical protein